MLKYLFIFIFVSSHLQALQPFLILFGPPGSGKGTFSQLVKESHGYTHLSVGGIVREEIDQQTDLGKEAEIRLQQGQFLKESTIQTLIIKHIVSFLEINKPFILDGFPRTPEAVIFIQDLFSRFGANDKALLIMLKASDDVCINRIMSRIFCKNCEHVYNEISCTSKKANTCDICSSQLKVRSNDTIEIALVRLNEYHEITEKAYENAKAIFPSIEFNTELPVEECLKNYIQYINENT